jgi:hypothetical protein
VLFWSLGVSRQLTGRRIGGPKAASRSQSGPAAPRDPPEATFRVAAIRPVAKVNATAFIVLYLALLAKRLNSFTHWVKGGC